LCTLLVTRRKKKQTLSVLALFHTHRNYCKQSRIVLKKFAREGGNANKLASSRLFDELKRARIRAALTIELFPEVLC